MSSIDELEDFAMGSMPNNANKRSNVHSRGEGVKTSATRTSNSSGDDLESFFSMNSRPKSAPKSRATTSVRTISTTNSTIFVKWGILLYAFRTTFQDPTRTNNRASPRTSSGSSPSIKKVSSPVDVFDDLSSMFGGNLCLNCFVFVLLFFFKL